MLADEAIDPSIEVLSLPANQPRPLLDQQQMDESDQSVHRIARFSESHGGNFSQSEEDISAVTDDEQAPGRHSYFYCL